MRTELIKILVLGWSLGLALAQDGTTALGIVLSKDGLRAASIRTALGGNPFLHLNATLGKQQSNWTTGLSLTQFLTFSPCRGACRRTAPFAPYLDFGVRLNYAPEITTTTPIGHAGAGILFPLSFIEVFGQANLYTTITNPQPKFDIAGGIRIRF